MIIEITVEAQESRYSYGVLAKKTLSIESDDPAIFQIGPTAQDMLRKVVAEAQAKIDEQAEAETDTED